MFKVRIIPTLLFKDVELVKGIRFDSWRRVGSAMTAVKIYNLREVDELLFLDITATNDNRRPDFKNIDEIADECFMPLTVGGGIRTVEDINHLLRVGADKIAINTAAVLNPEFIRAASQKFGSQCIVVSIDVKKTDNGYRIFTHSGTKATNIDPVYFAIAAEKLIAGEMKKAPISVKINIAGKQRDLSGMTDKLVNIVRQVLAAPQMLENPQLSKIFNQILEYSGISPIDFSTFKAPVQAPLPTNIPSSIKEAMPV